MAGIVPCPTERPPLRVLLVQSWLGRSQPPVIPLGLATLAASLTDHEVMVVDPNTEDDPLGALEGRIRDFEPQGVCISLRNLDTTQIGDRFSYLPAFERQLELIRKLVPNGRILVGGSGFSLFPEQIMGRYSQIDAGLTGDGEISLPSLLADGQDSVVEGVPVGDREGFLAPRWDLVDPRRYMGWERNLAAGVEVSRGCSGRCGYCSYPLIGGRSVRRRPLAMIMADIEYLHLEAGIGHFFLVSSVFNSDQELAEELCMAIRDSDLNITWEAYHQPTGISREYVRLLHESGCRGLSISADGGCESAMDLLDKDFSPQEVESALRILEADKGVKVSLNIFPDVPGLSFRDTITSVLTGRRWGRLCGESLARLRFGSIRMIPRTSLFPGRSGRADQLFSDLPEVPLGMFYASSGVRKWLVRVLDRLMGRRLG